MRPAGAGCLVSVLTCWLLRGESAGVGEDGVGPVWAWRTRPGIIDAVRIEKGLKKYHRRDRELLKEKGCTAVVSCTMVHVGR